MSDQTEVTGEGDVHGTAPVDGGKKRPGRRVSELLAATRGYEQAHNVADKARAALDKVKPLADAKDEAEAEEALAYEDLQAAMKDAGLIGS